MKLDRGRGNDVKGIRRENLLLIMRGKIVNRRNLRVENNKRSSGAVLTLPVVILSKYKNLL
jgi:hypothetical protein